MAQIVKLRRSSVSGQKPTNSNLQLGELALNTTDGKVFMAVSGSLGPSVEELILTNTINTGSINLSGSINLTGSLTATHTLSGSALHIVSGFQPQLQLKNTTTGNEYHIGTGGQGLLSLHTGDNIAIAHFSTSSIHFEEDLEVTGSVSATEFTGSGLGLTNVPFQISGSDLSGNTYNKQFTKLQFDDSTGLNVEETDPGTAFISIGSHFKDIFVYGQPLLSATGSDAFEIIGHDGIDIATSIVDTNGNGYTKELTIGATTLSSSLNNRIDEITGSIDNLNLISSSFDLFTGSINEFTTSVVLTSETSSMTVLSSSYALTAAFALNAGSGGSGGGGAAIGSYETFVQSTPATTWDFEHNIGQRYPIIQVFNSDGDVVIPTKISTVDNNNVQIIFSSPQSGRAIASLGGGNGTTQAFTGSTLWTVDHNLGTDYPDVTIWDSNKNIVFPNRVESVTANQIKIYFSAPVAGHVSVSRGGHILSGSNGITVNDITWTNIQNKPSGLVSGSSQILNGSGIVSTSLQISYSGITGVPSGIVSGSEQLTGSYDTRYVLSGSITQTTWDNIANKPNNIVSNSYQVSLTGVTGYSDFSSSISTSISDLSSSVALIDNTQNGRLTSLETESGSIRTDFNSFTSSYTTVSGSLDSRLDILETYSGSQLVPSSSMSFRTLQTDVYCKNVSGVQINKGTVVRIVGSTGDNPLIGVADPTTEHSSANVLGIATVNIPNDSFGLVITEGVLVGVNTNGMTAGDLLYLGPNGTFVTTPTVAPNHGVRLGEVLRVQQNNGSIYVRVDNGIELNEAHDVIYTGITHGDLLVRSGSVWKNSKTLNGDYTVTGSLTVTQNLTVLGSSSITYVTSSQLQVATSTISVNVFEPAERFGGLKVYDSGSSNATASLLWDSERNHWVYQNASGSNYSGGMLIMGPRNSGSLGDESSLTNGKIPKSIGGDHIGDSIMSESGTTITLDGNLVADSITGSLQGTATGNLNYQGDWSGTTHGYYFVNDVVKYNGSLYVCNNDVFGNGTPDLDASYTILSDITPNGTVSGSSQISYTGITDVPSGIVSSSSQISYSGITNVPSNIVSGSDQLTGSYDTRYVLSGSITQTTWDNIASKPDGIISGSSQILGLGFLQTSSFNTMSSSIHMRVNYLEGNDYTNGQRLNSLTSKTGSYATTGSNAFVGDENINGNLSVTGSVVISGSLNLTSANIDNSRYLHTQGSSSTTWTINHNLGYSFPNVTVYDADNKIMIPDEITSISNNVTQVTFAIAESGHALVSIGGISTSATDRFLFTAPSATGSWVIDHNLGYKYVNIDVYDGNDEQLIPQKVTAVSNNRTQIDFAIPTTGNAILTIGGPRSTSLFGQTGSFYNATTNIGITGSLVVTGDIDAANFNTTSDKKLKTDLIRIEGALDKIEKLNGYTFNWLEEYSEDRTRQIGMIADEVYDVQPELISNRSILLGGKEEEIKLLDYSKVTALLLEGIKELTERVSKLENKRKKK